MCLASFHFLFKRDVSTAKLIEYRKRQIIKHTKIVFGQNSTFDVTELTYIKISIIHKTEGDTKCLYLGAEVNERNVIT